MPVTVLDAFGFDRTVGETDATSRGDLIRDTEYKVDGTASLRFHIGIVPGEWLQSNFQNPRTSVAVGLYIWPRDMYYTNYEYLPRLGFYMSVTGYYLEFIWSDVTYTMDLYLNEGGERSLLEAGTIEVSQNEFFNFQTYMDSAGSGFVRSRVDGHLDIDYEYDFATIGHVRYTGGYYDVVGGDGYKNNIDNLVIAFGDWTGDAHVDELTLIGDDSIEWTPFEEASNYLNVDETPEDDADFNYARADGLVDDLNVEVWDHLTDTGATKNAIAVLAIARARALTATGEAIYVGLNSNGSVASTRSRLAIAYNRLKHVSMVDPDTAATWTPAAIQALLLRYVADLTV